MPVRIVPTSFEHTHHTSSSNGSGDIFLAFATGNAVPAQPDHPFAVQTLPAALMNGLFDATADAVEESILNALCAAEAMTGYRGRTVYALPLEELVWS